MTGTQRVPGIRAPWITGLVLFLLLAVAAGVYMARPRDFSPVPQSVLDARRETTVAASQAVARSLNGGLSSLAEIATVVDESMQQRNKALLIPFRKRIWKALYVVDRSTRAVVAQVGEPAQPAVLGEPMPAEAGMRLAQVGTSNQIVQYTPVGKPSEAKYLLVGHLDPNRLTDLLAVAGPQSAWLLDNNGSVIAGPNNSAPPQGVIAPAAEPGESSAGSRAQRNADRTEVVAWTSLPGKAPANALNWTVVSNQATTDTNAPADDSRRRAITLSIALATLTVFVFLGLYLLVLRPIGRLGRGASPRLGEAGRIAEAQAHVRRTQSEEK
ncbi:hypothetical protein JOF56_008217 [Kibdelosporangium banguiense]|uniref:HAMP domain-containing protein n=1 Tax=Kibdelosporangium banguiense TaxID=1365924 RepID=A0ABS4TTV2_9PSEU|nr:cache domain-containing protein [Kibdelosporangium banguiense]MBP2327832.1 hypothetical protein [Kibdelosporangium banguiense]